MIFCAIDVISNPVYIKKDFLTWIDDQHQGLEQADEEKPVEDIFLGIYLDYSWFFDDLVKNRVDWDHYHHQQGKANER